MASLTLWKTIKRYPMAPAIDTIYMVEASAQLRNIQKNLLCGPDARLVESRDGWKGICKHTNVPIIWTETIEAVPKRKTGTSRPPPSYRR